MNYNLTTEQDMIIRSLRSFREQELELHEAAVDRGGEVSQELGQQIKSKALEMDFNPMMVTPHRCIIVDVLIRKAV